MPCIGVAAALLLPGLNMLISAYLCCVCGQAAEARAYTESSTGKEAQLARELAAVRDDLDAALADKAELETALGLLDRNSKAQIEQLQVRGGWGVGGGGRHLHSRGARRLARHCCSP